MMYPKAMSLFFVALMMTTVLPGTAMGSERSPESCFALNEIRDALVSMPKEERQVAKRLFGSVLSGASGFKAFQELLQAGRAAHISGVAGDAAGAIEKAAWKKAYMHGYQNVVTSGDEAMLHALNRRAAALTEEASGLIEISSVDRGLLRSAAQYFSKSARSHLIRGVGYGVLSGVGLELLLDVENVNSSEGASHHERAIGAALNLDLPETLACSAIRSDSEVEKSILRLRETMAREGDRHLRVGITQSERTTKPGFEESSSPSISAHELASGSKLAN